MPRSLRFQQPQGYTGPQLAQKQAGLTAQQEEAAAAVAELQDPCRQLRLPCSCAPAPDSRVSRPAESHIWPSCRCSRQPHSAQSRVISNILQCCSWHAGKRREVWQGIGSWSHGHTCAGKRADLACTTACSTTQKAWDQAELEKGMHTFAYDSKSSIA